MTRANRPYILPKRILLPAAVIPSYPPSPAARVWGGSVRSIMRIETIKREARGIALAVLLVAGTTLVADGLVYFLGIRRGSVIYLLAVLVSGWRFGLWPAIVAAVTGVLGSGFLFYTPASQRSEWLDLALFLIVALVASHVANSMKQQTELARKREKEISDLYAFSRRLAVAPSAADIHRRHRGAPREPGPAQGRPVRGRAARSRDRHRSRRSRPSAGALHAAIAEIQEGRTTSRPSLTDGAGDIWLVRRVSGKNREPSVSSPSTSAACRRKRSRRSGSGSQRWVWRMQPPRSSGLMWRASSMTPRCARRPSCCAKR